MKGIVTLITVLALALPTAVRAGDGEAFQRDSWYIGFGLGFGSLEHTVDGRKISANDWLAGSEDRFRMGGSFRVGWTLSPNWLLGLDINFNSASGLQNGVERDLTVYNFFGVATWFPQGEGFFVRGGAGFSDIDQSFATGKSTVTFTESGHGVQLGAGYAWRFGERAHLTVSLDLTRNYFDGGPGEPTDARSTLLSVGVDWY